MPQIQPAPQIVIENNNSSSSASSSASAAVAQTALYAEQIKMMVQAQVEAQKEILDMQKKAMIENTAFYAGSGGQGGGGMSAAEQAKMIADVVAQTQSSILTETMGQMMHRQEESQRFQAT